MKEVLRTHSLSWAQSVRLALEAHGIDAVIQDENALGFVGLAGELRIAVADEADVEPARAVIAAMEAPTPGPTGVAQSWKWQRRGLKLVALSGAMVFLQIIILVETSIEWVPHVVFVVFLVLFFVGMAFILKGFLLARGEEGND